ncbi:MAG: hypothetical protein WCJ14_05695 [Verrucomicrobiota bacterium]
MLTAVHRHHVDEAAKFKELGARFLTVGTSGFLVPNQAASC